MKDEKLKLSDAPPNAQRLLVAMYRLAKGRTDVAVDRADAYAECVRERLFDCSDEEFAAYRVKVRAEVDAYRKANEINGPQLSIPGAVWSKEPVNTRTGKGCPGCLWPMPTNITFEVRTHVRTEPGMCVDFQEGQVIAMRFACPGCGNDLCFRMDGGPFPSGSAS